MSVVIFIVFYFIIIFFISYIFGRFADISGEDETIFFVFVWPIFIILSMVNWIIYICLYFNKKGKEKRIKK